MRARVLACMVLSALCLAGCTTYLYEFVDGTDGSAMTMREIVFLGERDQARSKAVYHWDGDGGGDWAVGGASIHPDTTEAIPAFTAAVESLRDVLKLLVKVTGG